MPYEGTGRQGGKGNSKSAEHGSLARRPRCFWFKQQCQGACSRGRIQHENAHESGNDEAHKCKLEYQGYNLRAVPADLVLGVVSNGHQRSTTAPRRTVTRGDPR